MTGSEAARFSAWVVLTAFSAMCLAAHENRNERERLFFRDETEPSKAKENWVTAVTSISTAFGFLSVLAYFVEKEKYVGKRTELTITVFLGCVWAGGLPVITSPTNHIAAGLTIIDYNLYFFSWVAFDAILYVLGSFFKASGKVQLWSFLTLCSIVVMGASSRLFRNSTCQNSNEDIAIDCTRIRWAIGLGAVCTIVSLVVTTLQTRNKIGAYPEIGIAIILLLMYGLGVGFITYGDGPGSLILGNLYFFTWLGFITVLILASYCSYKAFNGNDRDKQCIDAAKPDVETTDARRDDAKAGPDEEVGSVDLKSTTNEEKPQDVKEM